MYHQFVHKVSVVRCLIHSLAHNRRHLFAEQHISRNILASPFCLRQFASFSDALHLSFLFELCPGGDCMDVLVTVLPIFFIFLYSACIWSIWAKTFHHEWQCHNDAALPSVGFLGHCAQLKSSVLQSDCSTTFLT